MKVLILTQWFDPEPGAIRGLPLARWLVERGHTVEVITGFPNYPGGRVYDGYRIKSRMIEEMDGVRVIRVPLYPSHDDSAVKRVFNYLSFALSSATIGAFSVAKADVCFVVSPPPTIGIGALVLKYLRGIPYIYHVSDMWPDSAVESGMFGDGLVKRVSESVLTWWCNLLYRKSEQVTVLADTPKQVLIERGVPQEKLHVVYNWADEDLFYPMERDQQLASEVGIDLNHFNLIYAGNFGVFQNLSIAIRAAHSIEKEFPQFRLILIGTGTEEPKLKSLVGDLGVHNVKFIERMPYQKVAPVSALGDAMLIHLSDVPLLRWTVPSKTQTALAMGIPLLMAATSDTARLISESRSGVVVSPDSVEQMTSAMIELNRLSPEALAVMGRRGYDYYKSRIGIDVGANKMLELFSESAKSK